MKWISYFESEITKLFSSVQRGQNVYCRLELYFSGFSMLLSKDFKGIKGSFPKDKWKDIT